MKITGDFVESWLSGMVGYPEPDGLDLGMKRRLRCGKSEGRLLKKIKKGRKVMD